MELKQLQYFLVVADCLNFSRAAEQLYISQPALSYHIAELERELKMELFVRAPRQLYLTAEGQSLRVHARQILHQAEELPHLILRDSAGPERMLRIGFDDTEDHFEFTGITQAIADLLVEHPQLELELRKLPFTECADQVIYNELDVAFLILRHKENLPPSLISKPVYRNRIVLVVRTDCNAVTCAEAIKSHELLLIDEKPRGNSRILKILSDMKLEPAIRRVDSLTSAFIYVQAGKGIMLLPEIYYEHHNYPNLRAIKLDSEVNCIAHEAVWNRANENPNVRKLLCMLPNLEG